MSLRFRKSIKVAPGVKVNFNKKSASVTVGGKRAHITKNTAGRTTTSVNLPVKGLSYVDVKTNKKPGNAPVAPEGYAVSASVAPAKEPVQKVKIIAAEPPAVGTGILGGIIVIAGFFLSGSSVVGGIIIALIGACLIYATIDHKRHPDKGKYITENDLSRWRQLLSVNDGSVKELGKASLPVLTTLKQESLEHLKSFTTASTAKERQKYGDLLIACQQKIVDFAEFVILKGDDPHKDLNEYTALISQPFE